MSKDYNSMTTADLREKLKELGVAGYSKKTKSELIKMLTDFTKEKVDKSSGEFSNMTVPQLREKCKERKIPGYSKKKRDELIAMLEKADDPDEEMKVASVPLTGDVTFTVSLSELKKFNPQLLAQLADQIAGETVVFPESFTVTIDESDKTNVSTTMTFLDGEKVIGQSGSDDPAYHYLQALLRMIGTS